MSHEVALGLGSSAVVIVPKAIDIVDKHLPLPSAPPPPSVMLYDITNGLYTYSYTVGDLITTIAILSTLTFLTLGIMKYIRGDKPKRRKSDV